jgi:hypothetical protein
VPRALNGLVARIESEPLKSFSALSPVHESIALGVLLAVAISTLIHATEADQRAKLDGSDPRVVWETMRLRHSSKPGSQGKGGENGLGFATPPPARLVARTHSEIAEYELLNAGLEIGIIRLHLKSPRDMVLCFVAMPARQMLGTSQGAAA